MKGKAYSINIAKSLDNQVEGLAVVPHSTKQEHHFQHQVPFVAHIVCLSDNG